MALGPQQDKVPGQDETGGDLPTAEGGNETLPAQENLRLSRVGTDVAATFLVCCGLGWYVDHTFGTMPWFIIGMSFLGAIVASVNVVRLTGGYEDRLGWRKVKKD